MAGRPKKLANQKDFSDFYIGKNDVGDDVVLSNDSLLKNGLLVVGKKNTGKSSLLANLAIQTIVVPTTLKDGSVATPTSNAGFTFVTSKKDQSYLLYAMAKKYHRSNIVLLKPSVNTVAKDTLLGINKYNYDELNNVINYVEAIDKKAIVIIDMEEDVYGEAARAGLGALLLHLQVSMYDTIKTHERRHYLVIDDAYRVLPYIDTVLKYGTDYNVSTTLFFDSRTQYKGYESIIETNVQNLLLTNNIDFNDAKYYTSQLFLSSPKDLIGNKKDTVYYSFYTDEMDLKQGVCKLDKKYYSDKEAKNLEINAKKHKALLNKAGVDNLYARDVIKAYAAHVIEQQSSYNIGTVSDTINNVLSKSSKGNNGKEDVNKSAMSTVEKAALTVEEKTNTEQLKTVIKDVDNDKNDISAATIITRIPLKKAVDNDTAVNNSSRQSTTLVGLKKLFEKSDDNEKENRDLKNPEPANTKTLSGKTAVDDTNENNIEALAGSLQEGEFKNIKSEIQKRPINTGNKHVLNDIKKDKVSTTPQQSFAGLPTFNAPPNPVKNIVKSNTDSLTLKTDKNKNVQLPSLPTITKAKNKDSGKAGVKKIVTTNTPSKNQQRNNEKEDKRLHENKNTQKQTSIEAVKKDKDSNKYSKTVNNSFNPSNTKTIFVPKDDYIQQIKFDDDENAFMKGFVSIFDDITEISDEFVIDDDDIEDYIDEFEKATSEAVLARQKQEYEVENVPDEFFNKDKEGMQNDDNNINFNVEPTIEKSSDDIPVTSDGDDVIDIFNDEETELNKETSETPKIANVGLRLDLANLSNIPRSSGEHYEFFQKTFNEEIHDEGKKVAFFKEDKPLISITQDDLLSVNKKDGEKE